MHIFISIVAAILKLICNSKFKGTVHRIMSFSKIPNKFLLLLVYRRATVDPRY